MPDVEIKNYREYFNKGKRVVWVQLHDGTEYRLVVTDEPTLLISDSGTVTADKD
jgi:hypothetical protein